MRRRDFISGIFGTAAAWPHASRAQQSLNPIVGFLSLTAKDQFVEERLRAFRRGLADSGYIEGTNIKVEYRWADYEYDRLARLAADLVRAPVDIMVTTSYAATRAAKAASTTTPIIFYIGGDPVQNGLVESFSRPGGTLTGVYNLTNALISKRLELLQQLVPSNPEFAALLNPDNPGTARQVRELRAAAQKLGLGLHLVHAKSAKDLDAAFAEMKTIQVGGVVISPELFFTGKSRDLAALATRHSLPAVFQFREFVAAGGLMSYGTDLADSYRVIGTYAGRVLKGAKPSDLPVQQSTKVELIINLKTAKSLGIAVPLPLLGRADEIVE